MRFSIVCTRADAGASRAFATAKIVNGMPPNLFETLDYLEELLGRRRYLCGGQITEAD
jgi:glutathionyl-hydroquinone reductase